MKITEHVVNQRHLKQTDNTTWIFLLFWRKLDENLMSRKYLGFPVLGENLTVDTQKLVKKVVSICFVVADKLFECVWPFCGVGS